MVESKANGLVEAQTGWWDAEYVYVGKPKKILFVCNKRHEEECFCLYGYFWALSYFLNWLRFYQDSLFGGQEKDGWNEDWAMRRMVGPI